MIRQKSSWKGKNLYPNVSKKFLVYDFIFTIISGMKSKTCRMCWNKSGKEIQHNTLCFFWGGGNYVNIFLFHIYFSPLTWYSVYLFFYNKKILTKDIKSTQNIKRGMNHQCGTDTQLINGGSSLVIHVMRIKFSLAIAEWSPLWYQQLG